MREFKNRQSSKSWKKKRKRKISFDFTFLQKIFTKKLIFILIILFVFASVIYSITFTDYFAIKNIKVSGIESISQDEIQQAVRKELSNKIYGKIPENNFIYISAGSLEKKLKTAFPEIESVVVVKKFPSTLTINVKEKQPALVWCRNSCYFVNSQGVAFLPTNDQDLASQKKHYIKIIEQSVIPEETDGSPDISSSTSQIESTAAGSVDNLSPDGSKPSAVETAPETNAALEIVSNGLALPDVTLNDKVSDDSFIKFALDVNDYLSYNNLIKVKYYKTKGTKTRELIAYTDKNIRIYFDATRDAKTQTDNLMYFMEKGIDKSSIDNLKYIYLKNTDRIFYK